MWMFVVVDSISGQTIPEFCSLNAGVLLLFGGFFPVWIMVRSSSKKATQQQTHPIY